jgi:hypothetical protein
MTFRAWISSLFSRPRQARPRYRSDVGRLRYRPRIEVLEDRVTPTIYMVDALTDSGTGSGDSGDLLYCMTHANSNGSSSNNTIEFGVSGEINLTAILPAIGNNLTLSVPQNETVIVNGNSLGSVFSINSGQTVSIYGLSITGGSAGNPSDGGGIDNSGTLTVSDSTLSGNLASLGGGIYNSGSLTVNNSTISSNNANSGGGGGIDNAGSLTVNNSTLSGNSGAYGGGILSQSGTVIVIDCTLYDNLVGGGIYNQSGSAAVLNSTITGNTVSGPGNQGGGIENTAKLTLQDTIVAGNLALIGAVDPDFAGSVSSSLTIDGATYTEGYNIIGNNAGSTGFTNGVNGDQVGSLSPNNINPELGPLQNNGGPTETMALLSNSPAINAGVPNLSSLSEYDQRGPGFDREAGGRVDIGAFESDFLVGPAASISPSNGDNQTGTIDQTYGTDLAVEVADLNGNPISGESVTFTAPIGAGGTFAGNQASVTITTNAVGVATAPAFTANGTTGSVSIAVSAGAIAASLSLTNANPDWGGSFTVTSLTDSNPSGGGDGSGTSGDLRYTLNQADNSGGNETVTLAAGLAGTIDLAAVLPNISANVSLVEPLANAVTVDGDNLGTVFTIDGGETVSLSGLTITGGNASNNSGGNNGGGIYNLGTATVSDCTVSGNSANYGGGIFNSGTLTVSDSTILGNSVPRGGGGIANFGTATVNNSTISGNSGVSGGGVENSGGILAVSNSAVSDNFGIGIDNSGSLTVSNSAISGNSASNGGGIYNFGTATVSNSTISGNTFYPSNHSTGGGIYNSSQLTLTDSTISDNTATYGGGIYGESGTLTVSDCTLYGNTASSGGGIYNNGTMIVSDSTLMGNSATDGGGGGIVNFGASAAVLNSSISSNSDTGTGGGIDVNSGNLTLQDTIVAENNPSSPSDFSGSVAGSVQINGVTYTEGYNLIGNNAGSNGFANGVNGDQVGTSASPINPELGPLQNNGGPTETMALLANSPALNAGDPNDDSTLPEFDQRGPGFSRMIAGRVDIGAYESAFPPTPSQLAFANFPSTVAAGQDFNFQTDIEDLNGNVVTNDSSAVTATLTGPGSFASGSSSVQAMSGIASFYGMSIQNAGSYTLKIGDPADGLDPISMTFTVAPAAPASLGIVGGSGQSTTVGNDFATALQVEVTDAFGNPIENANVAFGIEPGNSGASATFNGNSTVFTSAEGVAAAPTLIAGNNAGQFTVAATVGSLTQEFSLTNTAGAAGDIAVVGGNGQNTTIGSAFSQVLQVLVTDSLGNPISGESVTFTAPASGPSGVFSKPATVQTNAQGIATAPAFTANQQIGNFTVTASIPGVAAAATFNLTITAVPAAIAVSSGSGQKATVVAAFANPLQVLVTNAGKKPVAGITVAFAIPANGPGGELAGPACAVTNANGIATSPLVIANAVAGSFTVLATVAGAAGPAKFTLTNTAGVAASVTMLSGSDQSAAAGKAFAKPLEAQVKDSFGNPVSGATVTFAAPGTGATGLFGKKSGITALTNAGGIAIASAFTANTTVGNFHVTASVAGVGTQATFSLSNLSSAPTKAKADAGLAQSAAVNQAFGTALQVLVTNSQGKAVSGVWVTFSTPASGASGNFSGTGSISVQTNAGGIATAPTLTANTVAGPFNVTAAVSGLTGSVLFALTNKPSAAASVAVAAGSGQSVAPGTFSSSSLAAIVKDAYGNVVGGVSVTFTIESNAGAGGTFNNNQTTVTAITNPEGIAIAPVLEANDTSGIFTVDASLVGLTRDAVFTLTNL